MDSVDFSSDIVNHVFHSLQRFSSWNGIRL